MQQDILNCQMYTITTVYCTEWHAVWKIATYQPKRLFTFLFFLSGPIDCDLCGLDFAALG